MAAFKCWSPREMVSSGQTIKWVDARRWAGGRCSESSYHLGYRFSAPDIWKVAAFKSWSSRVVDRIERISHPSDARWCVEVAWSGARIRRGARIVSPYCNAVGRPWERGCHLGLRLPLSPFVDGEAALGPPNPDKTHQKNQGESCTANAEPTSIFVALLQSQMSCCCLHYVSDSETETDAEKDQAVDEGACKTLSLLRHTRGDKDVACAEHDIDPDSSSNHGRKHVRPVAGVVRHDCKEEHADDVADSREYQQ